MAAYIVADVDNRDPEGFEDYRAKVPAVVERYGGRYLVRGGELHPVEGDLGVKRLVILESPSMEAALQHEPGVRPAPAAPAGERRVRHRAGGGLDAAGLMRGPTRTLAGSVVAEVPTCPRVQRPP